MSTRSLIIRHNADNSYTSIYCHFDGYMTAPHGVGAMLPAYYINPQKVDQLIALGDLSELGKEIGVKIDFYGAPSDKEQCIAYGRDRGEQKCEAKSWRSAAHMVDGTKETWAEFFHIFQNGEWHSSSGSLNLKWLLSLSTSAGIWPTKLEGIKNAIKN